MRRQLTVVAAATTAMVVLAFVIPLGFLVRTLAQERALTSAAQAVDLMAVALVDGGADTVRVALGLAPVDDAGIVTVELADGTTVGEGTIPDDIAARARAGEGFRQPVEGGLAIVTPLGGANDINVVQVVIPTERLRAGVAQSWAVVGLLGIAMVVGATLLADRLARRVTGPVIGVATAARELTAGNLEARAPVAGPPEVADVATALNGLAEGIGDLLTAEREAAADLSHRLRTPLTALRLDIEALGDHPDAARLAADLTALQVAVDHLIRQARTGPADRGPTDLVAVVSRRLAFWAPLADDEGRTTRVDVPDHPVLVDVDADDLGAAVDALVVNVLTHTPAATPFEVSVVDADDHAVLVVRDHGPGFHTHDAARRGHSGRGSTGLGLDICRRLAEEAAGTLTLSSPAPDQHDRDTTADAAPGRDDGGAGGARVELVLPRHRPR